MTNKLVSSHLCGQPAQQHGRRIPSSNSERTLATCWLLVSSFFGDITQQIHSFLASGVMSSHAAMALREFMRTFLRSCGKLCTVPPEIFIFSMDYIITKAPLIRRRFHLWRWRDTSLSHALG